MMNWRAKPRIVYFLSALVLALGTVRYSTLGKELDTAESSLPSSSSSFSSLEIPSSSWCPTTAQCNNSELCQPCANKFLILISSGRSASTTLTWMLDKLPGIRMSGENMDLLKEWQGMVDRTYTILARRQKRGRYTAFGRYPLPPPQALACASQLYFHMMNPPETYPNATSHQQVQKSQNDEVNGFKTIRFDNGIKGKELRNAVRFVQEHFPCSKVIVNYRSDTSALKASLLNSFKKKDVVREEDLDRRQEKLKYIAELFGSKEEKAAYLLDSSAWTKNISILNEAVDWLGFDPKYCHFEELLEMNTIDRYNHTKTDLKMNPNCRYLG